MGKTVLSMEQKELNLSIALRMAELAQEVFKKLPIPVGSYTANQVWEWVSEHRPKDEVMVEVEVGSFRCSMPEYYLFRALHEFEKLAGITQKKKERFIKVEKQSRKTINACERNKKPSIQPEEERASIIIMENDSTRKYKPEVRYAIEDLAAGNYKVKEGEHNEELKRAIQNMAYFALGKAELQIKVQDRFKEEYGDGHMTPDSYKLFPLPELELARLFMEVYQAEGIDEVPDCPAMEKDRKEEQSKCVSMPAPEPPAEMKAEVKVTSNEREIIPILELETSEGVMIVAGESYLSKLYDAERGRFFSPEAEAKFNEIDAFISDEIVLARPLDLEAIGEAVEEFMMEVERVS